MEESFDGSFKVPEGEQIRRAGALGLPAQASCCRKESPDMSLKILSEGQKEWSFRSY